MCVEIEGSRFNKRKHNTLFIYYSLLFMRFPFSCFFAIFFQIKVLTTTNFIHLITAQRILSKCCKISVAVTIRSHTVTPLISNNLNKRLLQFYGITVKNKLEMDKIK